MSIKNIAIILAGGSGTRFGGKIPKQFQFLDFLSGRCWKVQLEF